MTDHTAPLVSHPFAGSKVPMRGARQDTHRTLPAAARHSLRRVFAQTRWLDHTIGMPSNKTARVVPRIRVHKASAGRARSSATSTDCSNFAKTASRWTTSASFKYDINITPLFFAFPHHTRRNSTRSSQGHTPRGSGHRSNTPRRTHLLRRCTCP